MNRSLVWALGATTVLSLVALLAHEPPRFVAAIEPRIRDQARQIDAVMAYNAVVDSAQGSLPGKLNRARIEPASRDLFVLPAPAVSAPPSYMATSAPPSPPTPQAPELNLRFLGSMVTPSGEHMVYLARGDVAVAVVAGDRLDEGYVVESISADSLTLTYPPLNTQVAIQIAPPPQP